MLTTRDPLIAISSPYARKGELWTTFRRNYGPQGDPRILVAQAASREMNPTVALRMASGMASSSCRRPPTFRISDSSIRRAALVMR